MSWHFQSGTGVPEFLEIHWSSGHIGNPSKWVLVLVKDGFSLRVDELARENESKQAKSKSVLLCGLPRGVAQILGGSSDLKRSRFMTDGFPCLKLSSQENPSWVCPVVWVLVGSRCTWVDNQNELLQTLIMHKDS